MRYEKTVRTFAPSVFVGLGDIGLEIAETVASTIGDRFPDAVPLISYMGLRADGALVLGGKEVSDFRWRVGTTDELPGAVAVNFRAIQEVEGQLLPLLAEELIRLRRQEVLVGLADKGISVDEETQVYLCAPLCDAVGSALLIPMIGFMQNLLSGRLRGSLYQINVLGLLPDLFDEFRALDQAYVRSYCCLQELDWVGEDPRLVTPGDGAPYSNVYLFSGRNEDGVEVSSYRELTPMIGEVLGGHLAGQIASDQSFTGALFRRVEEKRTRYTSLGMTTLVLPTKEVMAGLRDACGSAVLKGAVAGRQKRFESELVNSDATDYVVRSRLNDLPELMETDRTGKSIEVRLRYDGDCSYEADVSRFLAEVEQQAQLHEETERAGMERRLAQRSADLRAFAQGQLRESLLGWVDDEERGPYFAVAFLSFFGGHDSNRLTGGTSRERSTVESIDVETKRFYDEILGVDRRRLADLDEELIDKRHLLAKWVAEESPADVTSEQKPVQASPGAESTTESDPVSGVDRGGRERDDARPQRDAGRIQKLSAAIDDLSEERRKLEEFVRECDARIADPSERRRILAESEAAAEKERLTLQEAAVSVDEALGLSVADLEVRRKALERLALGLGVLLPGSGLLGLWLVLLAIGSLSESIEPIRVLWAIRWFVVIALLVYYVWACVAVWRRGWVPYRAKADEVDRHRRQKERTLYGVLDFFTSRSHGRFAHALHGLLVDWIDDFRSGVERLRHSIEDFVGEVEEEEETREARFRDLGFRSTAFRRSVIDQRDVLRLIEGNPRYRIEVKQFFQRTPLSRYLDDFLETRSLGRLRGALNELADAVFQEVPRFSVEDFVEGRLDKAEAGSLRLESLYASVKAFIHLEVEKGLDVAATVVFLGVENEETSEVARALRRQLQDSVEVYSTNNKSEISITRWKVGFPAFHVAAVGYGRALLMRQANQAAWYVEPEWRPSDLVPSARTLGGEGDEVRRLSTLACGLGVIASVGGDLLLHGERVADSYEALVEILRTFKSRQLRVDLQARVAEELAKDNAVERLVTYREEKELDEVDRRIIEQTIMEISPLA